MVWFLKECVLSRPAWESRHMRARTREDGEVVKQTLGRESIKAYKSAIVNLWSYQQSCRTNSYPHPVGQAVRALLHTHSRKEDARHRTEFVDRGIGTLLDGYDQKDIVRLVTHCWEGWTEGKKSQSWSRVFVRL